MIRDVRHTGIVVTDLEAALRFYRDLLGFRETKRLEESGAYIDNMLALDGAQVTTVKLTAPDGNLVELLHFRSHPRPRPPPPEACRIGITHIAFTVEDLEHMHSALTAAGVRFNAPPQLSPDGYAKVTFCRDPDGTLIELVQVL